MKRLLLEKELIHVVQILACRNDSNRKELLANS